METELVKKTVKIMGIALALPSMILGVFFTVYYLSNEGYISEGVGLSFLLLIVGYSFYLMVRYALAKK